MVDYLAKDIRIRDLSKKYARFMQLETQDEGLFYSDYPLEEKRDHREKERTFASTLPWMPSLDGGEVGDEEEKSLEDLELYVDALRNVVVHCLDDGRDRREGDGR